MAQFTAPPTNAPDAVLATTWCVSLNMQAVDRKSKAVDTSDDNWALLNSITPFLPIVTIS